MQSRDNNSSRTHEERQKHVCVCVSVYYGSSKAGNGADDMQCVKNHIKKAFSRFKNASLRPEVVLICREKIELAISIKAISNRID